MFQPLPRDQASVIVDQQTRANALNTIRETEESLGESRFSIESVPASTPLPQPLQTFREIQNLFRKSLSPINQSHLIDAFGEDLSQEFLNEVSHGVTAHGNIFDKPDQPGTSHALPATDLQGTDENEPSQELRLESTLSESIAAKIKNTKCAVEIDDFAPSDSVLKLYKESFEKSDNEIVSIASGSSESSDQPLAKLIPRKRKSKGEAPRRSIAGRPKRKARNVASFAERPLNSKLRR